MIKLVSYLPPKLYQKVLDKKEETGASLSAIVKIALVRYLENPVDNKEDININISKLSWIKKTTEKVLASDPKATITEGEWFNEDRKETLSGLLIERGLRNGRYYVPFPKEFLPEPPNKT